MNEPLLTIDDDSSILNNVPIPELHLLIGVTTHIFKYFEKDHGEVAEEWLRMTNIQLTHKNQFNGNGARTLWNGSCFFFSEQASECVHFAFKKHSENFKSSNFLNVLKRTVCTLMLSDNKNQIEIHIRLFLLLYGEQVRFILITVQIERKYILNFYELLKKCCSHKIDRNQRFFETQVILELEG